MCNTDLHPYRHVLARCWLLACLDCQRLRISLAHEINQKVILGLCTMGCGDNSTVVVASESEIQICVLLL